MGGDAWGRRKGGEERWDNGELNGVEVSRCLGVRGKCPASARAVREGAERERGVCEVSKVRVCITLLCINLRTRHILTRILLFVHTIRSPPRRRIPTIWARLVATGSWLGRIERSVKNLHPDLK